MFLASIYGFHQLEKDFVYPIVPVAIKADFLSEAYFSELSEQYDQIRSDHRKWYVFDTSKAIASHAILTHMMHDLAENQKLLKGHKHFDLFFETFDQHVKQLPSITKEIHYFRNELNRYGKAPEQLEEMIELVACGKWQLYSARFHRYEVSEYDAANNVKFISSIGRFEVVFNIETGQMVNDPVNRGTYNYAPGGIHPWKYYQHHKYDKVPWKKWGNTNQISYKDITKRQSRHGSTEQRKSTEELQNLIKYKMSDSQKCRNNSIL
ncbi:hypothetical protein D1B31_15370 [Neobacillus notoginsengisoli]|uniref:DUF3114 domain-containing protein n=1 Tax=Neobacillus notoginsengisoli TaxID=1578198 RepID=A0A417YSD1_9BACI|nr:hypothetical protein D1B31_15370 [Neobacillus notoginsengisoli]